MKFIIKYLIGSITGGAIGGLIVTLLNDVAFWKGFLIITLVIAFVSNPISFWITRRRNHSSEQKQ